MTPEAVRLERAADEAEFLRRNVDGRAGDLAMTLRGPARAVIVARLEGAASGLAAIAARCRRRADAIRAAEVDAARSVLR